MSTRKGLFVIDTSTLIEAQGTWLKTFAWDWYFTGTFARPVSVHGARFHVVRYVQSLQRCSGTKVAMYWSAETGPRGGNVHVHGLIANVGTMQTFCGSKSRQCASSCGVHLWRCGMAEVLTYRENGAAPFYISKTVFRPSADWDLIGTPVMREPTLTSQPQQKFLTSY